MQNADLAGIVDLHFDVLENSPVTKFHSAKCEGLTNSTDFCNFVADGANLCAKAHSKKYWDFVTCMYSVADPNGDEDGDAKNPLAHSETFDKQATACAEKLSDYKAEALLTCAHGSEGAALRKASAAKTSDEKFRGPVWIVVDGKVVPSPTLPSGRPDEKAPRGPWIKNVTSAICASYTGQKPKACAEENVMV